MDSVTVVFPRCNTERTVPWSTVVVFDADKVDQPWRPENALGVAENGFGPGASEVSAVSNTVGAINVCGTTSGELVIGSKFGQTLVPNTLASPRPKRMPPSMKARTTGRPGFYETWRHVPLANENADWTRAQVAKGHHRAHDPRWCVRTAVGMQQWEPDGDVFLQAQRDAQTYRVGDSVFLEVKSGQWVPAVITATKLDGYRIRTCEGVHTKWGADQWFLAEQLSIYPRSMEGIRGQSDALWDVFTGNEASAGLLPQTQPVDRAQAGIRANNRFPASYESCLVIVVGVHNSLIKRSALVVDRPFPLRDGLPATLTHPKEIFRDGVTISMARSGDFGREFLMKHMQDKPPTEPGSSITELRIGPEEVEELLQSLYQKLRDDAVAEARSCLSQTGYKHRKRASNFFIDARDHLGGGDIIWDKRVYLEAKERGQAPPEGCITRLDVQQDIVPRINAKRFIERMDKSKNPDQYARQQLLRKGMLTHASQLRDTMIMVNHGGVAKHVGFCDGILEKEEEDGIVSRGYQEIPLCPGKNHSRNVAPGPRMCVDMGQPRDDKDGGGDRSPNATANTGDHTKHRNLKLTTPMDFFQRVGVTRVPGRAQRIGRMDYSRFYRQLLLAWREWWFHLIGVGGIFRLDFAVPFGTKIGPHGCHVAMDSLLDMIGDEFVQYTEQMTQWSDAQWDDSQFDKDRVLTALEAMDNHAGRRRLALMMAYPVLAQNEDWLEYQCDPVPKNGFYDDSLFASDDEVYDILTFCFLVVAEDIEIEFSFKKILVGFEDGKTGHLDEHAWKTERKISWILHEGFMEVLGKEGDVASQRSMDSTIRVQGFQQLVKQMGENSAVWGETATRKGQRVSSVSALQKTLGQGEFLAMSVPQGRPFLQHAYKALRLSQCIMPVLSQRYRGVRKFAGGKEPTFERFFYKPAVEEGLNALGELALTRDGVAFCVMAARPGVEGRKVAWAMLDAAGARMVGTTDRQLPIDKQGGGGAWILHWTKHGSPPIMEWRYRAWNSDELLSHSTNLEATNATEVAEVLLAKGAQDLVLVMDNASWIQDARILSCGAESMIEPLQAFARLLVTYPDARIFMLFNDRTKGKEADAISKAFLCLPEFGNLLGWQYASERLMNRGFPRLEFANMLEPRVEGVGADADRGSDTGGGFLAVCKAAGRQLEGHNRGRDRRDHGQSTDKVDGLLSSS